MFPYCHSGIACLKPVTGILFFVLFLISSPALRAADDLDAWVDESARQIEVIEKKLGFVTLSQEEVDENVKRLTQIQGKSQKCVDDGNKELEEAQKNLAVLGEPVVGEPGEISDKRRDMGKRVNDLKNRINACQLLLIQSGELAQKLKKRISQEVATRLFDHGPNVFDVLHPFVANPTAQTWWNSASFKSEVASLTLFSSELRSLWVLAGVAVLAGLIWRRFILRTLPSIDARPDVYDGFLLALRACFGHFLPVLAPLAATSAALIILSGGTTDGLLTKIFVSMTAALGTYLLIRAVLAPCKPSEPYLTDSPAMTRLLAGHMSLALLLVWVSYLLLGTSIQHLFDNEIVYLVRAGLLTGLVLLLSSVMWSIRRLSWAVLPGLIRLLIILALWMSLLAEYLGYRHFSIYLFVGTLGSLLTLGVAIILGRFTSDLFDQMDNGNQLWQIRLRKALGVTTGERIPGLMWMRLLVVVSIWGGFAYAVLRSWGLSRQSEQVLFQALSQGFDIGSFHVVPSRILLAILIFALVLSLSRLIKKKIAESWVKHTHLDRGARDAVVTIVGYIGFILALLVSLSIAGIEFKNIAVIAGALSVGIGFGLQNIVNNFVSGLILLFERPIRSGDWIQVGNTEGYVKSINIRSTEIQTFDRADVIVPNSELISGQVTNWQLHDPVGRVRVPIGVAYGSNTESVRDILLKIASDLPDVITDSQYISPPKVLFREFGDSALSFELRFFIRDIDRRLDVLSKINFAIDKAFRDAEIEIPYPQRDIHIKRN